MLVHVLIKSFQDTTLRLIQSGRTVPIVQLIILLKNKKNITGYQYQIKQEKLDNVAVREISCIEVRDIS
jgi:hypothetical protein